MAELANLFRVRAAEHFDNVLKADTESAFLADAIDTRQEFLRGKGSVPRLPRRETIVTASAVDWSAGLRPGMFRWRSDRAGSETRRSKPFPKISQQKFPPAGRNFGVMNHLFQLRAGYFPFLGVGLLVNEPHLLDTVAGAEQQQAFAGQAIAARATGFLIVALDVLRQIVMNYEADVRLVDAHAKRDGRTHHARFVAEKGFLIGRTFAACQARVIGQRLHTVGGEFGRQALRRLARLGVNDPAFAGPYANVRKNLLVSAGLGRNAVGQVGAVETGDVTRGRTQMESFDDVLPHAFRGRGGERHHRHVREYFAQGGDLPVLRTEVVSPLADTMRLVNRELADVPFRQIIEEPGQHQPLGRDVEQPEFAAVQSAQPRTRPAGAERGIQERCRHARRLERVHLVLHQRNERRDDDGESGPHERGELKA